MVIPHLTLPSVGEDGLAGLLAVTSGPRSAIHGPRLSAIAVARGAIGMSGAVILGDVGVRIDGGMLMLGALSITPIFPVLVPSPKKDLGMRVG